MGTRHSGPKCCKGCKYWRALYSTSHSVGYCCHHIIDTGISNGRLGDICPSREVGKHEKKRIPPKARKNRTGE